MIHLTTDTGRQLEVEWEHYWPRGRTFYRVRLASGSPVGTVTLGWCYSDDRPHVWWGRAIDRYVGSYESLPEQPVVYGIPLDGGAVITWDHLDRRNDPDDPEFRWHRAPHVRWLATPGRRTGRHTSTRVPDATHKRAADLLAPLLDHWRNLPEHEDLFASYLSDEAPGRKAEALRRVATLRESIAKDVADLNQLLAVAEYQDSLILPERRVELEELNLQWQKELEEHDADDVEAAGSRVAAAVDQILTVPD